MELKPQTVVRFNEEDHTYFNTRTGVYMTSVSAVKKRIKMPFDDKTVSNRMAYSLAKQVGRENETAYVQMLQQDLLAQWKETKDIANIRGTHIHKVIEECIPFLNENHLVLLEQIIKKCNSQNYYEALKTIIFSLQKYFRNYSEMILYSEIYNVAGTSDHIGLRQNTKNSLIDIDDWKTNEFSYDSIKVKEGVVRHYNKMLLPPFDYLEESKYMDLALQLSIYGVLLEHTYPGAKVGRLTGHNIDHQGNYTMLPVPYMRMEAIAILEHNKTLKELPTSEPAASQPEPGEDDW